MHRFRGFIFTAVVAAFLSGCSEDQPNAPAKPEQVNTDFAAQSAADMAKANAGMDPKALKKGPGGAMAPKK